MTSPVTPALAAPRRPMPHYLAVALILLYALPIFLVHLGTGDANDMMEMFNLVPVKEAYRDGHWLMPTLNGEPRLQKPPLPVWLPAGMAAVTGSDSLWVLRLPAIVMGLLTCVATYGIGCATSRDRRFGLIAALLLATMAVFVRQARIASYDIFATAFTTVGLWGLVKIAETAGRRWPWAVLAGASLALANLAKGPIPPAAVCLPLGLWLLIYHRRNRAMWLNLVLAFLTCIVVSAPWFIAIEIRLPGAHRTWLAEFLQYSDAVGEEYQATRWYYFAFLAWVAPWTPLLIGGLVMPFMKSHDSETAPTPEEQRTRWLFWLIVVLGLALLTVPTEKKPRYSLQQFPAAALLCAAVCQQFMRITTRAQLTRAAGWLAAIQAALLQGAGLVLLLAVFLTYGWSDALRAMIAWLPAKTAERLADLPANLRTAIDFLHPLSVALFGLSMVLIVAWSAYLQKKIRFAGAFAWLLVAAWVLTLGWNWVYRGVNAFHVDPYRTTSERLAVLTAGHPVYSPRISDGPWLHVLFYANRTFPKRTPEELLAEAARNAEPLYLLIPTRPEYPAMQTAVDKAQAAFHEVVARSARAPTELYSLSDEHVIQTLYRLDVAAVPATGSASTRAN